MNRARKIIAALLAVSLIACLSFSAFAEPELMPKKATKTTLNMLNELRESKGLSPLKTDKDLMEAAKIRAVESAKKYSAEHIRPNGQKCFSVSTKVWAENTSYGQKTQDELVKSFAKSKLHLANMLDSRMTHMGYACAMGDDGKLYWVHVFGNGKSNMSWAMKDKGVKTFTLDPFGDPKTPMDKEKKQEAVK